MFDGDVPELSQVEPLADEVGREGGGLGILDHAPDLCLENFRVPLQLALGGQLEQFVVRHAAPEEIGQPIRQRIVVEFASLAVGHGEPILDTAKAELRAYLEQATRDG